MKVNCTDRERIFEHGNAAEWAALEAHAVSCAECAEEVRAWKELSVAAGQLRNYEPSSTLWLRIERALAKEALAKPGANKRGGWFSRLSGFSMAWQTALAGAAALLLAISATWVIVQRPIRPDDKDQSLLKGSTLKEVESAERAYEKAIDKLATEAEPELETPATPLLANYHEKLQVLDSAIDDLRAQAGLNPSNAQLRYQLLAMYHEKQRTLEEVLEAKKQ